MLVLIYSILLYFIRFLILLRGLIKDIFYLDILSKDCISIPTALVGLEEPQTKLLRIDDLESSAVIYSHDFESGFGSNDSTSSIIGDNYYAQYPLSFACEVVVHAPIENGRILLSIESFFLPSSDQTCKDDFLYVFDSNTARSKAMVR